MREIYEELGVRITTPDFLGVVENIFELDGERGHEIDSLYAAPLPEGVVPPEGRAFSDDPADPTLDVGWVQWRPCQPGNDEPPLYPRGLQSMIDGLLAPG